MNANPTVFQVILLLLYVNMQFPVMESWTYKYLELLHVYNSIILELGHFVFYLRKFKF